MMVLGLTNVDNVVIKVNGTTIKSTNHVKLLGITLDKDLNLRKHMTNCVWKPNVMFAAYPG